MSQMLPVDRLKPHPKNREYFGPLDPETREALKQDIAAHGVLVPLLVTQDLVIISGHERWQIAKELGMSEVPCEVRVVEDDAEAERLLVADNVLRRQLSVMERARLVARLKESWGVRRGINQHSSMGHVGPPKTVDDIAEALGESPRTVKRLARLNDLIPELAALVDAGKLGAVAAEQLAALDPEAQKSLYSALGESLGGMTAQEARELRKRLEAAEAEREAVEEELRAAAERLSRLQAEADRGYAALDALTKRVKDLEAREEEARRAREDLASLRLEIERLQKKKRELGYDVIDYQTALEEAKKGETPNLKFLRCARALAREVNARLADLEALSPCVSFGPGNTMARECLGVAALLRKAAALLESAVSGEGGGEDGAAGTL